MAGKKRGAAPTWSRRALNRASLARQLLLERAALTPEEAVARLLVIQAQWPHLPLAALQARLQGFTREAFLKAVQGKRLVRGTLMRGTLHLSTAEDFRWLRPALTPHLLASMNQLGGRIDEALVPPATALGERHFAKGAAPFEAFRAELETKWPEADVRALAYAVRMALPLLQVPDGSPEGWATDPDFQLAPSWLGQPLAPHPSPVPELLLRCIAAHGPCSVADLQAFLGLTKLKAVVESLGEQLMALPGEDGVTYFDLPGAPRPPGESEAPVRLLAAFDSLVVARKDQRVLEEAHRKAVFLPGLRVEPTFTVDGFAAGTWKASRKGKAARLVLTPFGALAKGPRKALEGEAEALLALLEPDAASREVGFGPG